MLWLATSRAQLKGQAGERAPSFNDLIVKASALALRGHPRANASYRDGAIKLYGRVNIGIAVAAPNALAPDVATPCLIDHQMIDNLASDGRRSRCQRGP